MYVSNTSPTILLILTFLTIPIYRCVAKELTAEQPMSVLDETVGEDLNHLHANVSKRE